MKKTSYFFTLILLTSWTCMASANLKEKCGMALLTQTSNQLQNDSSTLDVALEEVLKSALQQSDKGAFFVSYDATVEAPVVYVENRSDYLFTKKNPHLIIHRSDVNTFYFDVFLRNDQTFERVLSHEQSSLTYSNDSVLDINGDGFKDFVVDWYGSSRRCLKGFGVLHSDKRIFSESIGLINPTFSPKEKIVRGVCCGFMGKTDQYKYKWNATKIDTNEYVYYHKNNVGIKTGKVVASPNGWEWPTDNRQRLLDAIP